jgi:D-alanyl-D-alanine carboxypeptidase (penicillin-binding protein 5/6)
MVTRRQGLIGAFAALGAAGLSGVTYLLTQPEPIEPPIPRPASERPRLGIQYVVVDANSGQTILERYPDVRRQPASLTKMMTLAVVFKAMNDDKTNFKLSSKVTIPEYIEKVRSDLAVFDNLKPGDQYDARDLLTGAGSRSDAFSTIALALHVGSKEVYNWEGTESEKADRFIGEMNKLAAEIGMSSSHFSVITGSPSKQNLSTPHDIARLISYLDKTFPELAELTFGKPSFDIAPASKSSVHSSKLLRARPSEIDFAKTGYTDLAGYCLGVRAHKNGHTLIATVFGASSDQERNDVMRRILAEAATKLEPPPKTAERVPDGP